MMLAELVQSLQDVMIQFFMARTVGVDGTAAYGIVYPLLALMIGLSSFLVVGVLAVFSRDMGAGDQDSAALRLSAGITWAFFIMGAFSALCILFRSGLTALLGAAGDESYLAAMSMDALTLGTLSGPGFCALSILLSVQFFSVDRRRAILMAIQSILLEALFTAVFSLTLRSVRCPDGLYHQRLYRAGQRSASGDVPQRQGRQKRTLGPAPSGPGFPPRQPHNPDRAAGDDGLGPFCGLRRNSEPLYTPPE
jgi:hypothetical protein